MSSCSAVHHGVAEHPSVSGIPSQKRQRAQRVELDHPACHHSADNLTAPLRVRLPAFSSEDGPCWENLGFLPFFQAYMWQERENKEGQHRKVMLYSGTSSEDHTVGRL